METEVATLDEGITLETTELQAQIIELAIQGLQPRQIAISLKVTPMFVQRYLAKKEVRDYMTKIRLVHAEMQQAKMLSLLSGVLDDRLERLEEDEGRLAELSRKDTLDIMRQISEISQAMLKNEKESETENTYINLLQQVLK